jgi:hypothetical protein
MRGIPLTVAAALSLGVGLADANENKGGEGIAAAPQCNPATTNRCNQMSPLHPLAAVPEPEPKAPPAAQAKGFLLLY